MTLPTAASAALTNVVMLDWPRADACWASGPASALRVALTILTAPARVVIEGMAEDAAKEEASQERNVRRLKIERLNKESGYGATELDQLVEGYAERLEVEWIQRM